MYINELTKFEKRNDITERDNSIEHMWMEIKGKHSSFLLAVIYQPSSVLADKRAWLAKLDSLLAYVVMIWTGPIIIINLLEKEADITKQYNDLLETNQKRTNTNRPYLIKSRQSQSRRCHATKSATMTVRMLSAISKNLVLNKGLNEKNFNPASFVSDVVKLPFASVYGLQSSEEGIDFVNKLTKRTMIQQNKKIDSNG